MINKVEIIKSVDRIIAVPLINLLPPSQQKPVRLPRSILVIRPGGIGDAALLLPSIIGLTETFQQCQVDVLAEKRNAEVFSFCPGIKNVYAYDKMRDLISVMRKTYDAVIDTEQWHGLSAVIARMTRAPTLIGFATNERTRLFNYPVAYSHETYEQDNFFNLFQPLGLQTFNLPTAPYINPPQNAVERAGELLGDYADTKFVILFPGASIKEKQWEVEKFVVLAGILQQRGIPVVVVGAKKEANVGEKIVAGKSCLNLAGKTTLIETAAVLARAEVLVSGDSGILHIGIGVGKPTVSLFGPSNSAKWAPRGINHEVVRRLLPCAPCSKFGYTPKCSIDARCMADITVDEVVAAVGRLIKSSSDFA